MSSRTSFWCPYCERVGTCSAEPVYLSDGDGPSNRIAVPLGGDADTDPQAFYRNRRCSRCQEQWHTVEIPEHFLSGLLDLRGRLLGFLKQAQRRSDEWRKHYHSARVAELDEKEWQELLAGDDLDGDLADDDDASAAPPLASESPAGDSLTPNQKD